MELTNLTDEEKAAAAYAYDQLTEVDDKGPRDFGWASDEMQKGVNIIRLALINLGVFKEDDLPSCPVCAGLDGYDCKLCNKEADEKEYSEN